jgi:hypothetical protein
MVSGPLLLSKYIYIYHFLLTNLLYFFLNKKNSTKRIRKLLMSYDCLFDMILVLGSFKLKIKSLALWRRTWVRVAPLRPLIVRKIYIYIYAGVISTPQVVNGAEITICGVEK